jgi:hypothetical protein
VQWLAACIAMHGTHALFSRAVLGADAKCDACVAARVAGCCSACCSVLHRVVQCVALRVAVYIAVHSTHTSIPCAALGADAERQACVAICVAVRVALCIAVHGTHALFSCAALKANTECEACVAMCCNVCCSACCSMHCSTWHSRIVLMRVAGSRRQARRRHIDRLRVHIRQELLMRSMAVDIHELRRFLCEKKRACVT